MEPQSKKIRIHFSGMGSELLQITTAGYTDYSENASIRFFRIQDGCTLHYVAGGRGTLQLRDAVYSIEKNTLFFVPPDIPFCYYADDKEPWQCFHFYMYGDGAYGIGRLLNLSESTPSCPVMHPAELTDAFRAMFCHASRSQEDMYSMALSVIARLLASQACPEEKDPAEETLSLAERIRKLIELNHADPQFSVNVIPEMLFISHSHMCKRFKEKCGVSPVVYLLNCRLEHAASLCVYQGYSVKEICSLSGFRDEYYFMKRFKKKFGMSVLAYKNHIMKNPV